MGSVVRKKEVFESFCVSAFIIACHVSKNAWANMFPAFDKEGQRGCRGLMPENIIPAVLKALDLGLTTLETDGHFTRDERVILSPDDCPNLFNK
jgi:glycerophosphoryl diester phosphodiesterase